MILELRHADEDVGIVVRLIEVVGRIHDRFAGHSEAGITLALAEGERFRPAPGIAEAA